jgi:Flp pilus assembly protein TadD
MTAGEYSGGLSRAQCLFALTVTRLLPAMKPPRSSLLLGLLLGLHLAVQADALGDARRLSGAGQPEQALAIVDSALGAKPKDAELRFMRGVLLTDLKRHDAALAVFTELNLEFPELPDPLNNLAVLQAARGDLDAARGSLEAALRNHPKHRAARENLGDVYLRLAIRHWESLAAEAQPEPALARKLTLARQLAGLASGTP